MANQFVEVPAVFRLVGKQLENGWHVVQPLNWHVNPTTGLPARDKYGTGGNFGVGYLVERDGVRAFMKAINLYRLRSAQNIIAAMTRITEEINFEKGIHDSCGGADRIVRAIDQGEVRLGDQIDDVVPYLVLELADGDVRRRLRSVGNAHRTAWKLRALHHAATGLDQMHKRQIAHQDVKPSNLMSFDSTGIFKVGDFGRCVRQGVTMPHDQIVHAGDPQYAPIELLYGEVSRDWNERRLGCDMYMLGGLLCWSFLEFAVTPLVLNRLAPEHQPLGNLGLWRGSYADVLPHITAAFTEVVDQFSQTLPSFIKEELTATLIQLCHPDPEARGHPRARAQKHVSNFDLTRYISMFNLLTDRAMSAAGITR